MVGTAEVGEAAEGRDYASPGRQISVSSRGVSAAAVYGVAAAEVAGG